MKTQTKEEIKKVLVKSAFYIEPKDNNIVYINIERTAEQLLSSLPEQKSAEVKSENDLRIAFDEWESEQSWYNRFSVFKAGYEYASQFKGKAEVKVSDEEILEKAKKLLDIEFPNSAREEFDKLQDGFGVKVYNLLFALYRRGAIDMRDLLHSPNNQAEAEINYFELLTFAEENKWFPYKGKWRQNKGRGAGFRTETHENFIQLFKSKQ